MMESTSFRLQALISLALLFCLVTIGFSQTGTKTVEWPKNPGSRIRRVGPGMRLLQMHDSIEIEEVTVEGKPITIGKSFTATDHWLKSIRIRVRNISNQPVSMIQMTFILPEMNASPDIPLCYGCSVAEKNKGVAPGEEVELKILGGGFYNWVVGSATREKDSIAAISKAEIRDTLLVLPSGEQWVSECVKTADSKNACPKGAP
jgi:hypothetical protein